METVGTISINRAPIHALSDLQRNIQHYYDMAAMALNLAEESAEAGLELPGTNMHLQLVRNEEKSSATVRAELINWMLRAGMRDCVEAVNGFLMDLRQQCATASLIAASGGQIEWGKFQQVYERDTEKFGKLGLPKKIRDDKTALKDCFGVAAPDKFVETVLSLNDARNCLVHRLGRVHPVDINDVALNRLVVRWLGCDLKAHSDQGVRDLTMGVSRTEAGEKVEIDMLGPRRKEFALGEPIIFSTQEFAEICWTFFLFGKEITRSTEQYFQSLGFLPPLPTSSGLAIP